MIGKGNDCLAPIYLQVPGYSEYLRVRCGHCIACKLQRSLEWSVRLELESHYWDNISFVTLTYNDDNLPVHYWDSKIFNEDSTSNEMLGISTLFARDLQLFIKRLRKLGKFETKHFNFTDRDTGLRYFAVGEYGTRGTRRPHYHLILFGCGRLPGESELIDRCWGKGFADVRPFYKETCVYVAGYVQKKLYGGKDYFSFREPEFLRASQCLGLEWILEHQHYFDDEHAYIPLADGKGHTYKHPLCRYFRKKLVEIGRLSEVRQIDLALNQLLEKRDLFKSLESKHIAPDEFFRYRYKLMVEKEKKHNRKRDYTGDNFILEK